MPASPTTDLLQNALALHRRGAVAEAAACYAEVLRTDPGNADAYYYLGMLSCQRGRFAEGADLARKSLAADPRHARAHILLGRAQSALGRHDEALACFECAIAIAPELAQAHGHRADVLSELGRNAEAIEAYDRALALAPDVVEDWFNRGVALVAVGRHSDAISSFDRAIAGKPDFAEAWLGRGNVLGGLKRHHEALAAFDRALALNSDFAESWLGRGNTLTDLKRNDDALAAYDRALALKPDLAEAWLGRGNVLIGFNRLDDALACLERALAAKPALAEAWLGRGNIMAKLARYDDAAAAYHRALALAPDLAAAWLGLAYVLIEFKRHDEAFAAFDRAVALGPDLKYAAGARLLAKLLVCDWSNLDAEVGDLLAAIRHNKPSSAPFTLLAIPSSAADQLQCARSYVQDQPSFSQVWRGEHYAHDRIRVAYLSADFRQSAMACLLAGLFEQHDKSRFEITAISFGPDQNSPMRRRLVNAFEHFIDVAHASDQEIADLVRRREIDIAVDLMGFTLHSRLNVLARRPAPVQVNYLGYPGTMAASYIDYILADQTVIPEDQCAFYSERVIWLPQTYLVNDNLREISERTPTRRECGLPDNAFVFCCFNNTYKITPEVFDVWMRLLKATENSVLWLIEANSATSENLRHEAERRGVSAHRLIFAPKTAAADHLARHRLADLFLDTLPYNAHTTASDALWAGLPLLTCLGTTFVGRVAASVLKAIGLDELIAHSLEEYEAVALNLAHRRSALEVIRNKLARNRDTCALFDTARSARDFEAAYTMMWERHQRGELPQGGPGSKPVLVG